MKGWFQKYINSVSMHNNSKQLKTFKSFLNAQCFWSSDQQCVARGVAAGLAGAVIPGFQILYATILVIILRGNLPIALLCTLVTNPLTVVPITYFIYRIGTFLIGNGNGNFVVKEFQWDFSSFHVFWSNLSDWFLQFGKGFLVGLPIVSVCLGLIGYFGTMMFWRISRYLSRSR